MAGEAGGYQLRGMKMSASLLGTCWADSLLCVYTSGGLVTVWLRVGEQLDATKVCWPLRALISAVHAPAM